VFILSGLNQISYSTLLSGWLISKCTETETVYANSWFSKYLYTMSELALSIINTGISIFPAVPSSAIVIYLTSSILLSAIIRTVAPML